MLQEFELTSELLKEYFDYDVNTGYLFWKKKPAERCSIKVGQRAGKAISSGYRQVSLFGKNFMEHRIIWIMHNGPIPKGYVIDHISGFKSYNRLDNLRLATSYENKRNRKTNEGSSSKYKGVRKMSETSWRARIWLRGKHVNIGYYKTEEEAARAYEEVARIAHDEFFNNGINSGQTDLKK